MPSLPYASQRTKGVWVSEREKRRQRNEASYGKMDTVTFHIDGECLHKIAIWVVTAHQHCIKY